MSATSFEETLSTINYTLPYYDYGQLESNFSTLANYSDVSNVTMDSGNHSNQTVANATAAEIDCYLNKEVFSYTTIMMIGVVTPFIIVFGIVANCLNFRIFTHRFMRVSLLNWYLAVLSVSDTVILLTGFFFLSLPRLGEYTRNFDVSNFSILIIPLVYPLALTAQTASVWLTVLMSTHRFIGVCLPFKTSRICTKKNCRIALAGVIIFAILFNISRFLEVRVSSCFSNIVNYTLLEPVPTLLRTDTTYHNIYHVWCYFIFMFLLPFLLLICLNTAVIMAIRKTSQLHLSVASGSDQMMTSKKKEMAKEVKTSIMLVSVVIVFLICNTLAFVVNVIELVDRFSHSHDDDNVISANNDTLSVSTTLLPSIGNHTVNATEAAIRFTATEPFHVMVDLSNVLVMINSSINIFIYCSFSEKFRLLLKHYLTCSCFNDSEPLIDTTMTTHA